VPASLPAPPAPTAEEWQLAATYTPRNSKRYRYAWGQQVRSMMGTAVEGPDQGAVRFRIEIAPDGKIARVEVLWSTSEVASKRAREAIRNLPPLPPIPTGKPLIFEQTFSFQPYETGWPPSYKLDCLPQPLPFNNPFAWNGSSPPSVAAPAHRPPPPDGCPPDSTEDTIEEEERSFERQMDQWRWAR
jgi:TonB family protein